MLNIFSYTVRQRNGWGITGPHFPKPDTCAECGDALHGNDYGSEPEAARLEAGYEGWLPGLRLEAGQRLERSRAICYECCGRHDVAAMRATGRATLYVSLDSRGILTAGWHRDYSVTNWPGTLRIAATGQTRLHAGGFGAQRTDVWFTFEGQQWHGVNRGDNGILRCKRLKGAK